MVYREDLFTPNDTNSMAMLTLVTRTWLPAKKVLMTIAARATTILEYHTPKIPKPALIRAFQPLLT
jgi:hypothetical protein